MPVGLFIECPLLSPFVVGLGDLSVLTGVAALTLALTLLLAGLGAGSLLHYRPLAPVMAQRGAFLALDHRAADGAHLVLIALLGAGRLVVHHDLRLVSGSGDLPVLDHRTADSALFMAVALLSTGGLIVHHSLCADVTGGGDLLFLHDLTADGTLLILNARPSAGRLAFLNDDRLVSGGGKLFLFIIAARIAVVNNGSGLCAGGGDHGFLHLVISELIDLVALLLQHLSAVVTLAVPILVPAGFGLAVSLGLAAAVFTDHLMLAVSDGLPLLALEIRLQRIHRRMVKFLFADLAPHDPVALFRAGGLAQLHLFKFMLSFGNRLYIDLIPVPAFMAIIGHKPILRAGGFLQHIAKVMLVGPVIVDLGALPALLGHSGRGKHPRHHAHCQRQCQNPFHSLHISRSFRTYPLYFWYPYTDTKKRRTPFGLTLL